MKKFITILILLFFTLVLNSQVKNLVVPGYIKSNSYRIKVGSLDDTVFRIVGNTTSQNIFIGQDNSQRLTTGYGNVMISYLAGNKISTGNDNINIGINTGKEITNTSGNVNIGTDAGKNNNSHRNTNVGIFAGTASSTGFNTFIGGLAGNVNTGGNNLFMGYGSGSKMTAYSQHGIFNVLVQASINDDTSKCAYHFYQNADTTKTHEYFNGNVNIGSKRGSERFNVWGNAKIYGTLEVTNEIKVKTYTGVSLPNIKKDSFAFWYDGTRMYLLVDNNDVQFQIELTRTP